MKPKQFNRRRALQGIGGGTALLGTGVFFGGCGGGNANDSTSKGGSDTVDTRPTTAPNVVAKKGGTLKVAMSADPTGLDPSTSRGGGDHNWLYSIFDNLVNNDPKFQVSKGIAAKWEIVDDLTVAFTIPETGFTYHDGTPFSIEDIKYTIERHLDPATKSFAAGSLSSVDKVELPDSTHAVIKLKTLTASLYTILGDRAGMIMSPTPTKKGGANFTNKPVGSGPFKLDSWALDASAKLSKFATYRTKDYPHMDNIDVQIVPNSSVQFANLRSGNADLIFVDAFTGSYIPFHLMTREFYQLVRSRLALHGVAAFNFLPTAEVFESNLRTVKLVFDNLDFFNSGERQLDTTNVILFGRLDPLSEAETLQRAVAAQARYKFRFDVSQLVTERRFPDPKVLKGDVLTDDFAAADVLDARGRKYRREK